MKLKAPHTPSQDLFTRMVMQICGVECVKEYNLATATGWRLLRTTPQELMTTGFVNLVKETVDFSFVAQIL